MADRMPETSRRDDDDSRTRIVAEPLSAEAFVPFGAVIERDGTEGRQFFPAAFAASNEARPHLWVNQVPLAPELPFGVKTLERHPFSAQNFLPLRGGRWLVVVAASGSAAKPRHDQVRAFVTERHQGLTYHRGIWHHGLVALDEPAEVAVVMSLTGRDDDTQVDDLARHVEVIL